MIGQILLTAPLVAILLYGWLEFERSWVGISISLITIVALYFVWFPSGASAVAETLQLGTRADLLAYALVALLLLVLLNLHLKNRRQMRVVTTLTRQLAMSGRSADHRRDDAATRKAIPTPEMAAALDGHRERRRRPIRHVVRVRR